MSAIKLNPGVQADWTPTYNETGITSSNLIRFKDGLVQKLGGWAKFYNFPFSSIVRSLLGWSDLRSLNHLAVGTTTELGVITSGTAVNITPQIITDNVAPNFSTVINTSIVTVVDTGSNTSIYDTLILNTPITVGGLILQGPYPIVSTIGANSYTIEAETILGVPINATATVNNGGAVPSFTTTANSFTVLVTFANHGLAVGSTVAFIAPTSVGGLTIQGLYDVILINSANSYSFNVSVQASSTATVSMNGGNAQLLYYISVGPPISGTGYGIGAYGSGSYGIGTGGTVTNPGVPITAVDWTLDNWGEILISCPTGGPIFYWSPDGGFRTASIISEAPTANQGIFIAMPQQILVAFGASVFGVQDPLLVAWCDVGNFYDWAASSTNLAGTFRLSSGSRIVGGLQCPNQALLWTDTDIWTMQYVNLPDVFNFSKIATGCGLIGKHAAGNLQNQTFWMSTDQFYVLNANGVNDLPCTVWDVIFQDLDTANLEKIRCAVNSSFGEIAWYYPSLSGGTGENDKFVKFNTEYGWDYGTLARSAWIDQNVFGQPIGADSNFFLQQHEISNDAGGTPLVSTFTTGYSAVNEGQDFPFVDLIMPDMRWGLFNGTPNAAVNVTFNSVNYPGDTPVTDGPYTLTQATQFINPRIRKRLISMTLSDAGSPLGTFWRLGDIRYRVAASGRR